MYVVSGARRATDKKRNLELLFGTSAAEIERLGVDEQLFVDEDRPRGGKKRRVPGGKRVTQLSERMTKLMGDANAAYLTNDFDKARTLHLL
jgi:hypothetical protein